MKKGIILCSLVMVLFFSLDVSAATKFKDVKDTAWYKVYLDKLVNDKVIDGMPDGTFQGQGTLNADQLLKLMVTTVNPYASYERRKTVTEYNGKTTYSYQGTWFEPYMTVLQSMNLIEPIEKTYTNDEGKSWKEVENLNTAYYNKPITREEVASWITKGYDFLRVKVQPFDKASDDVIKTAIASWYNDSADIDPKYYKDIYVMHETGIMNGDDKGNFNAKKVLTRAEVTKVIYTLQKARYKELDNRKIDFKTDAAFSQYVLRTDKDGKQYWELVLTKNGYVYSPDGSGETPSSDQTQGTVIKQVTTRVIDLSDFPLVDGDDTPEWGEDEKGFSDEYKEELKRLANMD